MADLSERLQSGLADRYRLERELGRGGMATVFLAQDLRHERSVALKVLHPELAATLGPERFLREIKLAARLQHPHILTVHDSGETSGQLWFTMPFVEGESLRDYLRRELQLPVEVALRIATDAARALQYAHEHGIIHRDIKPENLLLTKDGSTLVADFGIARALSESEDRLTQTGMSVGTPTYMSPEQAAGDRHLDARTDVYALGTVLYEMLAGEPPFTGATAQTVIAKRFSGEVPRVRHVRPSVPESVEQAVTRALAPVAADRFASAALFGAALTLGPARATGDPRHPRRSVFGYAASALLLAALVVGYVASRGRSGGGHTGSAAGAANSLAVLPLVNVGGDTATEYFSDGLTDELTSALGKVPGLRVAARSSAFAFKGKPVNVQEVGTKLHVANVLEGSVRRAGPRLRLTAQLVNVSDGLALWSETYEREQQDVFRVQEEIATAIASALRLTFGEHSEGSEPAVTGTHSLPAYDLYLKGRFFLNRGSETDLRHSLELFEQALVQDSSYAPAWVGIANAWSWLADDYLPPREAFPKAEAAARRALALDSSSPDAHAELGLVLRFYDWNYAAGERELQRAIGLNPNHARAHFYSGLALLSNGSRLDSALAVMRRAESLDPLNPVFVSNVGWALLFKGSYDEAVAQCRKALELDAQSSFALGYMGEALVLAGRPADALEVLRRAHDPPARIQADIARALLALGRRAEALKVLRVMERHVGQHYALPIASVYVALGDRDAMFRWIEKAYNARSSNMAYLGTEPIWEPVRADPRFAEMMKSVGVP